MRAIIATAALAVAVGTSASAALYNYEYDINYTFDGGSLTEYCGDLQTVCDRTTYSGSDEIENGSLSLVVGSSGVTAGGRQSADGFGLLIRGSFSGAELDDRGIGSASFGGPVVNALTEFTFSEDGTGSISLTSNDGVPGYGRFRESLSYTIVDFTVSGAPEPLPEPEVAPVPLPASGIMLLAGLGGLGAWRRKKA